MPRNHLLKKKTMKTTKEVFATYHHSGKEFRKNMSHIDDVKKKFKFACLMIIDNNAEGYVKDVNGKIYKIEQSNRSAVPIKKENYETINQKFFN